MFFFFNLFSGFTAKPPGPKGAWKVVKELKVISMFLLADVLSSVK